jgi:hypothetical protein
MTSITTTRPTGKHARKDFGADVRASGARLPYVVDDVESHFDCALSLAAIVALCGVAIFIWGVAVSHSSRDTRVHTGTTTRIFVPPHRVDIDRADVGELALLPEVGPGLAARIVADRAVRGAFGSVDALSRVEGIGPARLEAIRPKAFAGASRKSERVDGAERFDG